MVRDAKWYAGYMRIARAESPEAKKIFLEVADLIDDIAQKPNKSFIVDGYYLKPDISKCYFSIDHEAVIQATNVLGCYFVDASKTQPHNPEDNVLVIVSGKPCENITLHHAYQLASYSQEDGWIIQGYEEWENPDVSYWIPLPTLPVGLEVDL